MSDQTEWFSLSDHPPSTARWDTVSFETRRILRWMTHVHQKPIKYLVIFVPDNRNAQRTYTIVSRMYTENPRTLATDALEDEARIPLSWVFV